MTISRKDDFKLKVGNLFLAAFLSVVPAFMTLGFLKVHGMILCDELSKNIANNQRIEIVENCDKSNMESIYKYSLWIWLFITIPTWRWFYIWHYKRIQKKSSSS